MDEIKFNCFICPHGINTQASYCGECWNDGFKVYLKSDKHKANLKKDLERLSLHMRGGSQSCNTEEHN